MKRQKVIIIGAAGRDFHNFNMMFRDDANYEVVAFTANQIPYISNKAYPVELAGPLYPDGIWIHDESKLARLIKKNKVDICVMSYSDLPYQTVMEKASVVNAAGADFWIAAPEHTMLKSIKPVIAVCAVRTGCGKSQTSRYIAKRLKSIGKRVAIIRHPMPYGVLKKEIVERFEKVSDLDRYRATVEEREDYEPHMRNGFVVFAGVDYEEILRAAEKEADIILWDGGNNDAPFIRPDLMITVADPLRAGNELTYYPGETVARMADVLLINKVNSATTPQLSKLVADLKKINGRAELIYADSEVFADKKSIIKGKNILVIEDGPSITHGGMAFGAGTVAAQKFGARSMVSAKAYAVGEIKKTFERYPALGKELPAIGYSAKQLKDLETTINRADCDLVISATPATLEGLIKVNKPIVNVTYELKMGDSRLDSVIDRFAGA